MAAASDLVYGTLELLILKALSLGPQHGLGLARRVEQLTGGAFEVKAGSLFPALHRMAERDLVDAEWGESKNRRRAKYYQLTRAGRARLKVEADNWTRVSVAINRLLAAT